MALALMILITALLGTTVMLVYGKVDIKRIMIPMVILFIGDFLLLYAKFVVGDDFLTVVLYLPAVILLLIALISLIIILIKMVVRKKSKKKLFAILLSFLITIVIIALPALTQIDKFKLYKDDYFAVSDSLFQASDEGKLVGKGMFHSPPSKIDSEELMKLFSDKLIRQMKTLNRSAGVVSYNVADKNVIYFMFSPVFQSIDGIAICRNGKNPSTDSRLKTLFQHARYELITDGVYYFSGGQ